MVFGCRWLQLVALESYAGLSPMGDMAIRSDTERGLAVQPWARGFQLRAETKQRGLIAVPSDQLRSRRHPLCVLTKRQHQCRLAAEVAPDGEGREREDAPPILLKVVGRGVDPAQLH